MGTVTVRTIVPAAQIGLRCGPALGPTVGLDLPVKPNTVTTSGDTAILWLGPDEWLLVSDTSPAATLLPPLQAALAGRHAGLIDLGAARAVREIGGTGARDLLARGCAIDLHPRRFGPGRCAQTLLARTQILLHQTDAAPTFRLFVRPSFAAYLDLWLADAKSLLDPA